MGTRAVAVTSTTSAVVLPGEANLTGVLRLLEDLARLSEDKESADIVFLLGREESPVYAHRIIMQARCKNFSSAKCIGTAGNPTPIRMPHAYPETFRQFIHYVYTGKIMLQDSGIFEMLGLAQELGVEELWRSCEEHVSVTLSPSNACALLSAALDAQERILSVKGACSSFIERCFAYIGENAVDTVKTNAFCNLPKDAIIKLISSDYLGLEEEDVWRAVLNWAKYQTGVTQPTQHWTEEERARVCQHLSGVINHVRLLLIDSQVFAEEVEPTGAVPIELSLERYRYAALPNKHTDICSDKRLQPRIGPFLFPGSQILSKDKMGFQRLLNQWYGVPKQSWRLVYRASSHGYAASAFHRYCDGVSPTYVIILGSRGEICGGFCDIPWGKTSTKCHQYIPSEKAFLYTLINNQDVPPTKYDVVKKPFAICHHPEIGPIFGAGADLCISSNCNINKESYSNLPHSYDGEYASNSILMGDYYFSVVNYEVFTLSSAGSKANH
ncbi:PREDICTED: kelch-like protein 17 [Ceratosolen solmsi marchali]|uniref:Kelch-like protein 17 n=1 Tax=Ceratosolen solmsi marchali TaxID=326594 RepID=A0AAJ6YUZ4_9HYME|nr:PREDICTED: kelch-like protein 17 [Ceratosolen solmsi marchali]